MLKTRLRFRSILFLLFTFTAWAVAHGQITPSQDAYTNSASPTTNFGSATTLGAVSSAASIQTTYLQFDLSSVPSGYSGANVAKATLKLYVNAVTTAGSFNIDFVDGTWAEKTITSSLAPALGTSIASSVPLTTANAHDYVLIDVTSAVQAWLNGTQANDGIALVANSPLSASFDSKENTAQSQPAVLDLVLTGNGSGTITGVTTASGSGLVGGGTTGTLNVGLTNTCAAHQILRWSGTVWACASAASGTVTSVGSGTGLTGGPITGSGTLSIATGGVTNTMLANPSLTVAAGSGLTGGGPVALGGTTTLNLDTTKVPLLASANTFIGNQLVNGTFNVIGSESVQGGIAATSSVSGGQLISTAPQGTAPLQVSSSTMVPNLNANFLGGFSASAFATSGSNTFTGNQTITGNLTDSGNITATGTVTGNSYQIGSNLFAFGSYTNTNAFLGFAGNSTMVGPSNTGVGVQALSSNVGDTNLDGFANTAVGYQALQQNNDTSGQGENAAENTGVGYWALKNNLNGSWNTAVGSRALQAANSGSAYRNTAAGESALLEDTTGCCNTAVGDLALPLNTTGNGNSGLGIYTGFSLDDTHLTGSGDTFLGAYSAPTTGNLNNATAIGEFAVVGASNSLVLGASLNVGSCTVSNNCGNTFVGIGTTTPAYRLDLSYGDMIVRGQTAFNTSGQIANLYLGDNVHEIQSVNGQGIYLTSAGAGNGFALWDNGNVGVGTGTSQPSNMFTVAQGRGHAIADGWDTYSSRRWKTNIQPLQNALTKVEQLRGVSYDLKNSGKHEIGVIAEEVGSVVPEVVTYEDNGKDARGVDYSRLMALLIEAVKQQQRQIAAQQKQTRQQQRLIASQQQQIASLSRKVGVLEASLHTARKEKTSVLASRGKRNPAMLPFTVSQNTKEAQ